MTKRDVVVASTLHHHARLLKYYPRPPCAPSFVKSRIFRPLQTHFLLFQQIFFVLVCIHAGTHRVPPRVLASGPKPCGGNNFNGRAFFLSDRWETSSTLELYTDAAASKVMVRYLESIGLAVPFRMHGRVSTLLSSNFFQLVHEPGPQNFEFLTTLRDKGYHTFLETLFSLLYFYV